MFKLNYYSPIFALVDVSMLSHVRLMKTKTPLCCKENNRFLSWPTTIEATLETIGWFWPAMFDVTIQMFPLWDGDYNLPTARECKVVQTYQTSTRAHTHSYCILIGTI